MEPREGVASRTAVLDHSEIELAVAGFGRLMMTAHAQGEHSYEDVLAALGRHVRGDWSDIDDEDWAASNRALNDGRRLLSVCQGKDGRKFWIVTEWDRSATAVLQPEDY